MKKRFYITAALIFSLLFSACLTACTQDDLESAIVVLETVSEIMQTPEEESTASPIAENSTGLTVHFIDVGQADCALIICDRQTMLIDGGNVNDSNLVVSYLHSLHVNHLDYIICTHAHEDHVGGLSGALNACSASHVLCSVDHYDSKAFENFKHYTQQQGLEIEIPDAGDQFLLGSAVVTILGPVQEYSDTNNMSIVLRVEYGETSFLFTGDAEDMSEEDILQGGTELSSTVLKVGHHGSETSTSYPFLREVMPAYAIICVGEDNSYDHPHDLILSRLEDAGAKIYRTDEHGHIIAQSDGTTITIVTEK